MYFKPKLLCTYKIAKVTVYNQCILIPFIRPCFHICGTYRQDSALSRVSNQLDVVCHEGLVTLEAERPVLVWNKTPSIVAMQKHVIRHQNSEKNVDFDVNKVITGDRYYYYKYIIMR